MTLGNDTEVIEVKDDAKIMQTGFSFTPLSDIEEMVQSRTLDVIGVILEVQPVVQIMTRDGQ